MAPVARWRGGAQDYDAGFVEEGRGAVTVAQAARSGSDIREAVVWLRVAALYVDDTIGTPERMRGGWERAQRVAMRLSIVAAEVAVALADVDGFRDPAGELNDPRDVDAIPALAAWTEPRAWPAW